MVIEKKMFCLVMFTILSIGTAVAAEDRPQPAANGVIVATESRPQPILKSVPVKDTSPASGEKMYQAYCAVCHGMDGKGSGPAASAMQVQPTDLTLLAKSHGGRYPNMEVVSSIDGKSNLPAHGSPEMPVWGKLFWGMSHGHEGEVVQRTANLNHYIETLQAR